MAISVLELGWTVGFIEGEGSFSHSNDAPNVRACQVQKEPLERLQRYFGGSLYLQIRKTGNPQDKPIWRWTLCGAKAAGLIMTMYQLLSPKRKAQALYVLNLWKNHPTLRSPRLGAQKQECKNGHKFVDKVDFKGHKVCFVCKLERKKHYRLERKVGLSKSL